MAGLDRIRGQLTRALAAFLLLGLAACGSGSAEQPRSAVDSVIPRDVAIRRFRDGLAEPARLSGGATSRGALVRRFLAALAVADTHALAAMAVTRAEFAFLYYESSPQSLPPYDLSPSLMWFTVEGKSRQDLSTALSLLGSRPLKYLSHTCGEPRAEDENRVHGFCSVRYRLGADTASARLFGPILERHGRFKFLSYGNKL